MAAKYGCLQEFLPDEDSIDAYLERAVLYFKANDIGEDKRVPIFLSSIGVRTYALLRDLVAPDAPGSRSFKEISEVLSRHFQPRRLVIAERFHFHRRAQAVGESIAEFDAALRKLATHCEFGETLEETLRDRFVCGLRHEATQRRLLTEHGLTYAKALEISKGMEVADSSTLSLKTREPPINKVFHPTSQEKGRKNCYRCGKAGHFPSECRFKDAHCHACGKKGHIAPVCRATPKNRASPTPRRQRPSSRKTTKMNRIQGEQEAAGSSDEEYASHKVNSRASDPVHVRVLINEKEIDMEVDTGAALSIISEKTRNTYFPRERLRSSDLVLKTYTNEPLKVVGTLNVRVQYEDQLKKLVLVVTAGNGPSLFGRNWLNHIKLNWKELFAVRTVRLDSLHGLMQRYHRLFAEGLGTVEPYRVSLQVREGAQPRFFKPRPVPFAIKDAIGRELDSLEEQGILKKLSTSDWAAPIVAVPKKDGKFRICGDYKTTINQVLAVEQYPLPKPDELFATLAKGKIFSKLDLSQAYLQLQLDDASIPYVAINTHQGLYTFNRLPFGVASAPAIFQKLMDKVLQGLPGVLCYIDDILVSGEDEDTHFRLLEEVFARLERHGFRLKQEKCMFLLSKVEYLGHQISSEGIHPLDSKIDAIVKAPVPVNVQQLRSFLGLINYYGKFIPNLSTLLQPLNELLQTGSKWKWSTNREEAFREAKKQLVSAKVLTHYNPALPIKLAADASAYGVGAVISHKMPDGSERPIAFASRTLTSSEKNYAQLEKEALSLIFGVKKFHRYLYGRKFTLLTDHQPLTTIFDSRKGIPSLAAARLQRWALLLSAYEYNIEYKRSREHNNADGLSRLPLSTGQPTAADDGVTVFNIGQIQALPLTFKDIKIATKRDATLRKVLELVRTGWTKEVPDDVKPYIQRKAELSVENGCLLWGTRVVIPKSLQDVLLRSLHDNHPGVTRMKALARSYFWWIGLDKDIECLGKSCGRCQAVKSNPPPAPLHPWVWPDAPWTRIHVDYAGPFLGKMFLVVVDAHSKWPEVLIANSTTSHSTMEALRTLFGRYGLPQQLVSDNGPQFVSSEFSHFLSTNGVKHIRNAPYHPSSNGQAERFVQTLKRSLKASEKDGRSLSHRLSEFLLTYRTTPHATTNRSPCELFLKRHLRTRFDLLRSPTKGVVEAKQAGQKLHRDRRANLRSLFPGSSVMVRSYHGEDRWIPGTVFRKLGPVTYSIDIGKGQTVKRHIDQLRQRGDDPSPKGIPEYPDDHYFQYESDTPATDSRPRTPRRDDEETLPQRPEREETPESRYPRRRHRPPDRFIHEEF